MEENPCQGLLEVGKEYSYKELCEAVYDKQTSGNSKKAQLKKWAKCFSWEHPINKRTNKPSKKFLITEVYDVLKEKEDGRKPYAKFNEYKVCGDHVELYIPHRGEIKICLTDTEDLEKVKLGRKFYLNNDHAKSIDKIWIHRLIMGLPKLEGRIQPSDLVVHHINGDSLDNRKCNLQILTQAEHMKLHQSARKGKMKMKMKDCWIHTAKNKNRYIQTYHSDLAHAIRYLTGIKFYKITIKDKIIHSFIYTDELLVLFNKLEKMKTRAYKNYTFMESVQI